MDNKEVETPEKETEDKLICSQCIELTDFVGWLEDNGTIGKCDFDEDHEDQTKVATIRALTERVNTAFKTNFQIGDVCDSDYDGDKISNIYYGDTLNTILGSDYQFKPYIVVEIMRIIPEFSDRNFRYADNSIPYETKQEANLRSEAEERYYYREEIRFQWLSFKETVTYKNRFFNIKEMLDEIFGKVEEYSGGDRKPIYKLKNGTKIYRARKLENGLCVKEIKKEPSIHLGAPPVEKTIAGRMNVEFIPVFYGAFSEETAVIETQPFLKQIVAVGCFTLSREIRVFDFTVFDKIDDEHQSVNQIENSRQEVISVIQKEISKPISPHNRTLEFIPTQIITEYLREFFNVDAIIFFSSLVPKTAGRDSKNIVIFSEFNPSSSENFFTTPTMLLPYGTGDKKGYTTAMLEICETDIKNKKIQQINYTIRQTPSFDDLNDEYP